MLEHINPWNGGHPADDPYRHHMDQGYHFLQYSSHPGPIDTSVAQALAQNSDNHSPSMELDGPQVTPSKAHHEMQYSRSGEITRFLQVPPSKRPRSQDITNSRDMLLSEKRRRGSYSVQAKSNVIQHATSRRPTQSEPKDAINQSKAQLIREEIARDMSNSSESILALKTRLLNIVGEGASKEAQQPQDHDTQTESDAKKKVVKCDVCGKSMARQCDLK